MDLRGPNLKFCGGWEIIEKRPAFAKAAAQRAGRQTLSLPDLGTGIWDFMLGSERLFIPPLK